MTSHEMKLENVTKAMQCAELLRDDLRQVHRDASPLGEIVALDLIVMVCDLQTKLSRYADALRAEGGNL